MSFGLLSLLAALTRSSSRRVRGSSPRSSHAYRSIGRFIVGREATGIVQAKLVHVVTRDNFLTNEFARTLAMCLSFTQSSAIAVRLYALVDGKRGIMRHGTVGIAFGASIAIGLDDRVLESPDSIDAF